MSEVIKCDFCRSTDICHKGGSNLAQEIGLTVFKCNDCEKVFWYNTGNSKTVVNIQK